MSVPTRQMKVVYLLGSLNRGGTETLLLDVFNNARKHNLNVVGFYRKGGDLEEEFIKTGIPFIHIIRGRNIIKYLFNLRNQIKKFKTTHIHAQQPIDALYAYIACKGLANKIILTLHGYDFYESKHSSIILKFILPRTDCNIFVSETLKTYYSKKIKLSAEKQSVVYNGIDLNRIARPSGKVFNDLKSQYNLSPETLLLGSVGNFNEVRDQITICRFLKLLKEQHLSFHFLFAGKQSISNPEFYERCVNFCSENGLTSDVSFLGSSSNVPEILCQLDAFVYSSRHDTFGIALVEAMIASVPVFVNDLEVMIEITQNGKHATVFKSMDENDLFRRFLPFTEKRQVFLNKAKDAAAFAKSNYGIEKHIYRLNEVYLNCD